MGSPLGPVLANIFMCSFEEKWVANVVSGPSIWFRYVDDTFSLFESKAAASVFLNYLNTKHPNIEFTMELEENKEIPFLDVLIKRNLNTFTTTVHRKTTFTGLYTKWDSFTPRRYKINLIRTLTYRCLRICSSSSLLQSTLFDLKKTLLQNGYPRGVLSYNINDVLNRQKKKSADPAATVPKKDVILVLPFLGFQSEVLARRVKSCVSKFYGFVNLKVIFQNTCRVKSFFPYKDRFSRSQRSKIVYKASCWDCDSFYIGKTKRRLHDRKTEHFKALTQDSHVSAVAEHIKATGHNIKWDHFEILASGKCDLQCKIKETLLISDLKPSLNENVGSEKLFLY